MKRRAVIVGVNKYKHNDIADLRFALHDAFRVRAFLDGLPPAGRFERTWFLPEPSDAEVIDALDAARRGLGRGDLLLFYFAGHGQQQAGNGPWLLLCPQAHPSVLRTGTNGAIPHTWLDDIAREGEFDSLFILDACRSRVLLHERDGHASMRGASILRDIGSGKQRGKPGACVKLLSCNDGEQSQEFPELEGGVFTVSLVEAMQQELCNEGAISLGGPLLRRVVDSMRTRTGGALAQTPVHSALPAGTELLLVHGAKRMEARPPAPSGPRPGEVHIFEGGEFAWIPPGAFQMGSKLSPERLIEVYGGKEEWKKIFEDEYPQHPVTISKGFWMGTTTVTHRAFDRFVGHTNYRTDAETKGSGRTFQPGEGWQDTPGANWRNPGWEPAPEEPVVLVSWNDAMAYCRWLREVSGETYRLPTEAEWEYACRAGSTTEFWWGDRAEDGKGRLNAADETPLPNGSKWDYRFPFETGHWRTAPVGQFTANAWNLHDMHGNVWEWCSDWYAGNYYERSPACDPKNTAKSGVRVLRGGSWYCDPLYCRAAGRYRNSPAFASSYFGFRVLRTP